MSRGKTNKKEEEFPSVGRYRNAHKFSRLRSEGEKMIDFSGKTVLDFAKTEKDMDFLKNKYGCKSDDDLKVFVEKLSDEANANEIVDFAQVTNKKDLIEPALKNKKKISDLVTEDFNRSGDFTN